MYTSTFLASEDIIYTSVNSIDDPTTLHCSIYKPLANSIVFPPNITADKDLLSNNNNLKTSCLLKTSTFNQEKQDLLLQLQQRTDEIEAWKAKYSQLEKVATQYSSLYQSATQDIRNLTEKLLGVHEKLAHYEELKAHNEELEEQLDSWIQTGEKLGDLLFQKDEENYALRQEIAQMESLKIDYEISKKETELLKRELQYVKESQFDSHTVSTNYHKNVTTSLLFLSDEEINQNHLNISYKQEENQGELDGIYFGMDEKNGILTGELCTSIVLSETCEDEEDKEIIDEVLECFTMKDNQLELKKSIVVEENEKVKCVLATSLDCVDDWGKRSDVYKSTYIETKDSYCQFVAESQELNTNTSIEPFKIKLFPVLTSNEIRNYDECEVKCKLVRSLLSFGSDNSV